MDRYLYSRLKKAEADHRKYYGGATTESELLKEAAEAIKFYEAMTSSLSSACEQKNKRIKFLEECIIQAIDALDRGADNDWAREALEKANI